MLLDEDEFIYKDILKYTEFCFERYFPADIRLVEKRYSNCEAGMGTFYLRYEYLIKNYSIIFDYENMYFSINILNENGGQISLAEICIKILRSQYGEKWHDWSLKVENIEKAVGILANVLDTEELYFYIYKNEKIYCEKNNCVKRIKDLSVIKLQLK